MGCRLHRRVDVDRPSRWGQGRELVPGHRPFILIFSDKLFRRRQRGVHRDPQGAALNDAHELVVEGDLLPVGVEPVDDVPPRFLSSGGCCGGRRGKEEGALESGGSHRTSG
jgi:hypothetical protein